MTEDGSKFYAEVPASHCFVDRSVQRTALVSTTIKRIMAAPDPKKFGTPVLSQRASDSFHIIEGANRIEAWRRLYGDDVKIYAEIHTGLTHQHEAEMFYDLNAKHDINPVDTYRVQLIAGDKVVTAADEVVTRHSYHCAATDRRASVDRIRAVRAIVLAVEEHSADTLDQVLGIGTSAWSHDGANFSSPIIGGLALFVDSYPAFDRSKLVETLHMNWASGQVLKTRAQTMMTTSGARTSRSKLVAQLVRTEYNKKFRGDNRLGYHSKIDGLNPDA